MKIGFEGGRSGTSGKKRHKTVSGGGLKHRKLAASETHIHP